MGSHNPITSYHRKLRSMFGIANNFKGVVKGGGVKENINRLSKGSSKNQLFGGASPWAVCGVLERFRLLNSGSFGNAALPGELPVKSCWCVWVEVAGGWSSEWVAPRHTVGQLVPPVQFWQFATISTVLPCCFIIGLNQGYILDSSDLSYLFFFPFFF